MSERLLSREEASRFLNVPSKTLCSWAYMGRGPSYYRVGRHARYRESDLLAWLADQRCERSNGRANK